MPPAIAAAGIGAAGVLGGAALSSRSANKATDVQSNASADALAFEREKEAARRAEYEQGVAAWAAGRRLLAARYGLNPDEVMPGGSMGVSGQAGTTPVAAGTPTQGGNLASLVQGQAPELGSWSDWSRYGLA